MSMKRELVGVPANETGMIRLFWIGQPISVEGLKSVMQASRMDPRHVDIIDTADLGEGGLFAYMVDGLGIDPAQIDQEALDGVEGVVAFMRTKAFGGVGQNLQLLPPIRYIGEYHEQRPPMRPRKIATKSAEGTIAGRSAASNGKAMAGKVAMLALAVMFAVVLVMILVGG